MKRAVLALALLAACKSKLPLEAKVTGVKPGTSYARIHVKSEKGVSVECMAGGLTCERFDVGASGEKDIEIDLNSSSTKKVVFHAKIGPRDATFELPVEAKSDVPATVAVDDKGSISCVTKTCAGTLSVAPTGHLTLTTEPGTTIEIGSTKLTADAAGKVDAPVDVPSLKEQSLKTLCGQSATALGTTTLALTFPDKTKVSASISITPKLAGAGLGAWAQAVAKGPLLFPWEKGTATKGHGAGIYALPTACFSGAGSKLSELSVVVLAKDAPREDKCEYALADSNNKSRGSATGRLTLHDDNATAYDRATGRSLGSKTFKADHSCNPDFKVKSDAKIPDQDAYANPTPIEQWAMALAH